MYSIVLMMALTSGGDVADGHRGSCGCEGGGGLFAGLKHHGHHANCCGAVASCGCSGSYVATTCGGGSCYGGCSGYAPVSNYCGCSGSAPVAAYSCYGSAPYMSGGCGGGTVVAPGTGTAPMKEEIKKMPADGEPKKEEPKKEEIKKPVGTLGAPAKLTVSMPADARFTIDNYTSPATSATHIVLSGPLGSEETKTYVLKAEVVRNGQTQTIVENVTVRAGEEKNVTLSLPTAVAAR